MNGNFEDTWADIQPRLPVRERIQNWSADKGYTGARFRITDVEPSAVTIEADGTSTVHMIFEIKPASASMMDRPGSHRNA